MKTASRFPRPTLVVSGCLCGVPCRWDGDSCPSSLVKALRQYARVIPVCPEMEIGLGVPRDRIVLVRRGKGVELYQPSTRRRLAQELNSFARRFLARCGEIDGFILKHKSPSCGLRGVKLYASTASHAAFVRKGVGLFAAEALQRYLHAASEDEERLNDPDGWEHFLTRLFILAAWRATRKRGRAVSLQRFHEYHRLLLGVNNQKLTRDMDRLCARSAAADPHLPTSMISTPPNGWVRDKRGKSHSLSGVQNQIPNQYEELLHRILQKPFRHSAAVAPLELALGHYASFLSAADRARFRRHMKLYLEGKQPLAELRKTIQVWAVRYDKNFIREHSFFRPYPGPLADA